MFWELVRGDFWAFVIMVVLLLGVWLMLPFSLGSLVSLYSLLFQAVNVLRLDTIYQAILISSFPNR